MSFLGVEMSRLGVVLCLLACRSRDRRSTFYKRTAAPVHLDVSALSIDVIGLVSSVQVQWLPASCGRSATFSHDDSGMRKPPTRLLSPFRFHPEPKVLISKSLRHTHRRGNFIMGD
ncbi:hypothetical protein B0T11DRAFT_20653 [Plectosphaerella cucumerina]|uniref:Uncharacterized protein n=1 Tax=Plectosphaerella cucumerina TaxID=40658 RepID=A0A8K0TS73_9PEZI|nr:hypothetical protein B0T11DRAFT_20653 [Plectosphaerella cucumerina]